MAAEGDARRVYAPGDVAARLGVSGQRVRQLAAVYERVHGDLPRDRRGRVWPEGAVEALELAHAAVLAGRAGSVEQALRAPEGAAEGPAGAQPYPAPGRGARGDTEALAAVLEELRKLTGAVEGMGRRVAGLERENRELRDAIGSAPGRGPGAPASLEARGSDLSDAERGPTDTSAGESGGREARDRAADEGERRPWWRRILGG